MRQTFDRLVGPVAVVRRPLPSFPESESELVLQLAPKDLARWRVLAGTRPTGQLRVEVAELRRARDEVIARAASRLGLCAHAPAVGSERAARLLRAVRDGYAASERGPLRDPLVRYAPGEDPRPMWKTHVDPASFERDVNDAIADTVAWALRALRAHPRAGEWEERAARIARAWIAADGAARLYRITCAEVRRTLAPEPADWVPTFALALLRSSTAAKDLRVHWQCLALIAPLLVVIAESNGASRKLTHGDVSVFDRVDDWRALAVEVNAWLDLLDELVTLDEELSLRQHATKVSTAGLKKAVTRLHDALRPRGFMLYHHVHDLEADDTQGIRAALEPVVSDRLESCGIGLGAPPGALISVDAAVLLSVQAVLVGRRCIECSRPARPGSTRCTEHQRAEWRARKARDRKARTAARRRPIRRGRR